MTRHGDEDLIRANNELRTQTEFAERREAKEWEERQERRREEIANRYDAMRISGRAPDGYPVSEKDLGEIFARASERADHDDLIEETQRIISEGRGGYVEAIDHDVELQFERARHRWDYYRRAAKDPALQKRLARELELKNRELDQYLWRQ
jgi:hypothetical protein